MKILVLAGGFDQIAFIEELKNRGHEVYLADFLDTPPAKRYVKKHYQISTLDEQAIYELARMEKFDLVTTACTDQALLTVARVSKRLGLNFYLDDDLAECVTNKSRMKTIFKKHGIPTAKFAVVRASEWLHCITEIEDYPVMVKPCDCNSSKGVVKVQNKMELINALEKAFLLSRSKQAIIENYIDGVEISVDAWVEDGCATVLSVTKTNKIKNNKNFTIYQSEYPVNLSDKVTLAIKQVASQIVEAFRLKNCPLLIQAIVSNYKIYVIEFSARMGGGSKYKLIQYMTGINIMKAYCNLILANKNKLVGFTPSNKCLELNYVYCYKGKVNAIVGFTTLKEKGVIKELFHYKSKGTEIEKMSTSSDRVLGFLIEADDKYSLRRLREYILQIVDIFDRYNNSMMYKKCFL